MKNGSFELRNNNYLEDTSKDFFNKNNHKRRANSNISKYSSLNSFYDKNPSNCEKINQRNQSHMATLLSLKQTEKEDIIKDFNDYNKKLLQNKKSSKKKNLNMKTISNNSKSKYKSNKKLPTSNKLKLKDEYSNYNTEKIYNKSNNFNKNSNKTNNIKVKNIKLNTFNNDKKQKSSININCINNNSNSKFDIIHKTNKSINTNKEYSISTNTNSNSYNKNINIITFGSTQSKKIPSKFVYIKKNNLCYSNSNLNKSKNKIHFNINSLSNIINENIKENSFQKAINDVNISEFYIDDNKENNDENINDITEEENTNKINISYIGKYKTIEQIEKKIESENMVKRIINNNLHKKINNMKFSQNNKYNSLYNERDIDANVLNTATFGSLETEKKY